MTITKYTCIVCGYVYDPEHGDPDRGIAPGTSFDDLPEEVQHMSETQKAQSNRGLIQERFALAV